MDFDLTSDQQALQQAFTQLASRFRDIPPGVAEYTLDNTGFDHALQASGFLDVAVAEGCGAFEAVLLIEALANSPRSVETVAAALVAPLLVKAALPRPLALARTPLSAPVRFLTPGKGTLLIDDGSSVRIRSAVDLDVEAVEGPFNYPVGRPRRLDLSASEVLHGVDVQEFRRLWRLGLTAEIVGGMQPAFDITVEYVKQRRQFGQPLGAFQAIQHRLSECHVLIEGARLLLYEAALEASPTSAALALSYAQDAAATIINETQQFHGAMGLTLEYPLHYWTYRLRLLMGELGGTTAQGLSAADELWRKNQPVPDTFLGRGVAFG